MIVLDTHAWIWWASHSRRMPARVRRKIDREDEVGVPAISCWEVGMLVTRGRLKLDRDVRAWVREALSLSRVALLPLQPEVAVLAAALPDYGGDPADDLIVSTARSLEASLATADSRITESGLVHVVW